MATKGGGESSTVQPVNWDDDGVLDMNAAGPIRRSVTMLGARGVGKTATTRCLGERGFIPDYVPTTEEEHIVEMEACSVQHRITVLDSAGQDARTQLPATLVVGIDAYVMMFNVHSLESFHVIQRINDHLLSMLAARERTGTRVVPRVLVGNKIDLGEKKDRQVSTEQGKALANQWQVPYFESSARTGEGVAEPLRKLMYILLVNTDDPAIRKKPEPEPKRWGCVVS